MELLLCLVHYLLCLQFLLQIHQKLEVQLFDQFLKFVNLVSSGIEAKMIIKDGQVKVNGEVELRRGKKLHDGDQVEFEGNFYCINAHQ